MAESLPVSPTQAGAVSRVIELEGRTGIRAETENSFRKQFEVILPSAGAPYSCANVQLFGWDLDYNIDHDDLHRLGIRIEDVILDPTSNKVVFTVAGRFQAHGHTYDFNWEAMFRIVAFGA